MVKVKVMVKGTGHQMTFTYPCSELGKVACIQCENARPGINLKTEKKTFLMHVGSNYCVFAFPSLSRYSNDSM